MTAVPIRKELGGTPVKPDAHIDLVPVDFVASSIASLVGTRPLAHRTFHISAGASANTFTVTGWTGGGSLTGGGVPGGDTVVLTKDADFTLTDTSLSATGGPRTVVVSPVTGMATVQ